MGINVYACLGVHTYVYVWRMWKLYDRNSKLATWISTLCLSIRLYNLTSDSLKASSLVPLSLLLLTSSFIIFSEQPGHVLSSTTLVKLREATLWNSKQRPTRSSHQEGRIRSRFLAHHSDGSTLYRASLSQLCRWGKLIYHTDN